MIRDTRIKYLLNIVAVITACAGSGILFSEIAVAASKFDINAAATAATNPLITAIDAHWGKVVLLSSVVTGLLGEGDGIQRAKRAGIGAAAAGSGMLGLLALFN